MTQLPVVQLSIPAQADFVAVARLTISGVAARMNFTIDDIEDIKVAVSEACTNAVQHAYAGGDGLVTLVATMNEGYLEVSVSDSGKGFDTENIVSSKQDGANDALFGLGLGLTFIKSLMDTCDVISSRGAGTTIRMTKRLAPPPATD